MSAIIGEAKKSDSCRVSSGVIIRSYKTGKSLRVVDPPFSNLHGGFTINALDGAPQTAFKNKSDGTKALANTVASIDLSGPNEAAIAHLETVVQPNMAYITGGTGVLDVKSTNNCLNVTLY